MGIFFWTIGLPDGEFGEYIELVKWVILQHFGVRIAWGHYPTVETRKT